jgi:hypothetical protein
VAIQVGTSLALRLRGFRGRLTLESDLRRQAVSLMLMAILAVTLGSHGLKLIRLRWFESEVRSGLQSALASRPDARLVELRVTTRGGHAFATAVIRAPERFTSADVAGLEKKLPRSEDGELVTLTVRHVALDVVRGDR